MQLNRENTVGCEAVAWLCLYVLCVACVCNICESMTFKVRKTINSQVEVWTWKKCIIQIKVFNKTEDLKLHQTSYSF